MRYDKGHKAETRQHILDVASRKFRREGVAAAGLAGLMAEAGLTHGGFYGHFASKEELVQATLEEAFALQAARGRERLEAGEGIGPFLRGYLSARHRDAPEDGCPTAALAAEIGRHPAETRACFGRGLALSVERIAELLAVDGPAGRTEDATALYALMIGTLQMARAVADRAQSDAILAAGLKAALVLAGKDDE